MSEGGVGRGEGGWVGEVGRVGVVGGGWGCRGGLGQGVGLEMSS